MSIVILFLMIYIVLIIVFAFIYRNSFIKNGGSVFRVDSNIYIDNLISLHTKHLAEENFHFVKYDTHLYRDKYIAELEEHWRPISNKKLEMQVRYRAILKRLFNSRHSINLSSLNFRDCHWFFFNNDAFSWRELVYLKEFESKGVTHISIQPNKLKEAESFINMFFTVMNIDRPYKFYSIECYQYRGNSLEVKNVNLLTNLNRSYLLLIDDSHILEREQQIIPANEIGYILENKNAIGILLPEITELVYQIKYDWENYSLLTFYDFLYFSIATITTIGYGDIVPTTTSMRLIVGIEAFLGTILLGAMCAVLFSRVRTNKNEEQRDSEQYFD